MIFGYFSKNTEGVAFENWNVANINCGAFKIIHVQTAFEGLKYKSVK